MTPDHASADPVSVLPQGEAPAVTAVLAEAFRDYPVMRFVLGNRADYDAKLEWLVTFFVMARVHRGETMLGLRGESGLVGAALVSNPNDPSNPPGLEDLRDRTWGVLGPGARARYLAFGAATAAFHMDAPHIHLNMIGVLPAHAGRGLGKALLEAVHAQSAADPSSTGVSLTTEVESNIGLYERFGYEVVGHAPVESAFTTWGMFRPDR